MQDLDRRNHWEKIYREKAAEEVSWYQPVPETSLELIAQTGIPADAAILDIGGGDSHLADELLKKGHTDITVLDISAGALEKTRARLGEQGGKIKYICSDIMDWQSSRKYSLWHDRAAFHFLTDEVNINAYKDSAYKSILPGGFLVLGTFAEDGPEKCSALPVRRWSDAEITGLWQGGFEKIAHQPVTHNTPFGTGQKFNFWIFRRV